MSMSLLLLISILLSPPAWSSDHSPEWTRKVSWEDARYKYYVGRSGECSTERQAFDQAIVDAQTNAARDNYETSIRLSSETYETIGNQSFTKRVQERFKQINFTGFEDKEAFHTIQNAKHVAYLLFRYSKDAINAERTRQAKSIDSSGPIFSEQGSPSDDPLGTIEITTTPEHATVSIDGEAYGRTPIRLHGQINPGLHRIRLDHPEYEVIEQDLIVISGKTSRIHSTLIRATAELSIRTDPESADVRINGRSVGKSPVWNQILPAGKRVEIRISHPETETRTEVLSAGLSRNEHRVLELPLSLKPAFLSVTVEHPGATVTLDGTTVPISTGRAPAAAVTSTGQLRTAAGIHVVRVEKDGFEPVERSVRLAGGQTETLSSIRLTPIQEHVNTLYSPHYVVSLVPWGVFGSTLQSRGTATQVFGGGIAWTPIAFAGLELGYLHGSRTTNFSNADLTVQQHTVSAGIPVRVLHKGWIRNDSILLTPEVLQTISRYHVNAGGTELNTGYRPQIGFGASIAYRVISAIESDSKAAFGLGIRLGGHTFKSSSGSSQTLSLNGRIEWILGF